MQTADDRDIFLSTMPATGRDRRAALAVVGVSSVLFALAHAYQGGGGVVGTLLLGTVFGLTRILYDSLVPVVVWHATMDIVAGLAGRRYLIVNK